MASYDSYSDIDDSDIDSLTESFNKAAEHVKKLVSNSQIAPAKLLEIYAFFKQSTSGPCNTPSPKWYEMQAKQKWNAWKSLGDLPCEAAKKNYIKLISDLDENFDPETSKSESWVTVSTLVNTDEIVKDSEKTVFDFVKDGDYTNTEIVLKNNATLINLVDADGLSLMHWAADRGNLHILKLLVELKAEVNLRDNDGQTPMHYSASCDHLDCVKLLIKAGGDVNAEDSDGLMPKDLASDRNIVELLTKI